MRSLRFSPICLILIICLAAVCAVLASARPQDIKEIEPAPEKKAEREVRELMEKVQQAALKGDSAFFQQYFDDDLVRVEARGQMVSKDVALLAMKTGAVKYHMLEPREMLVRVYGDTAVVSVIYDFQMTRNGKKSSGPNWVTRVLVKRAGKWREVAFQATHIEEKEPGVRVE